MGRIIFIIRAYWNRWFYKPIELDENVERDYELKDFRDMILRGKEKAECLRQKEFRQNFNKEEYIMQLNHDREHGAVFYTTYSGELIRHG